MLIRILAFDHGAKAIGVASGQSISATAEPLTTLRANAGKPRWREIKELVDEWQPTQLVVGLPLNMDGTETSSTPAARQFAAALKERYGLPVALEDERLTSIEAERGFEGDDPRSHAQAAALIGQQWLSAQQGG